MAKLPIVAIIGKPNVGKSTLFNRLVGSRRAIISPMPGTTRDHVSERVETSRVDYLLLDTGGIGGGSSDRDLEEDVALQSQLAVESADLILCIVDGKAEVSSSDFLVAKVLREKRRHHVAVLLVVNKCDNAAMAEEGVHRFHELNIAEEVLAVSAGHGLGMQRLHEVIEDHLTALHFGKETREVGTSPPRLAVVGRPNTGKSSIVNALMSDAQRAVSPRLVSDIPGTTRDSADTVVRFEGQEFIFVDTAGLRQKSRVEEGIEFYATLRSIQAMEDAEVTLLVLDASRGVARQDKVIANLALRRGSGLLLLLNKFDLIPGEKKTEGLDHVRDALSFCPWAPLLPCSARSRDGLLKIFPRIAAIVENRRRRIPTAALNRWFEDLAAVLPWSGPGTRVKYVAQVEASPPRFAVFARNAERLPWSTLRFIERRLRDSFDFDGVPIRWVTKGGRSKGE